MVNLPDNFVVVDMKEGLGRWCEARNFKRKPLVKGIVNGTRAFAEASTYPCCAGGKCLVVVATESTPKVIKGCIACCRGKGNTTCATCLPDPSNGFSCTSYFPSGFGPVNGPPVFVKVVTDANVLGSAGGKSRIKVPGSTGSDHLAMSVLDVQMSLAHVNNHLTRIAVNAHNEQLWKLVHGLYATAKDLVEVAREMSEQSSEVITDKLNLGLMQDGNVAPVTKEFESYNAETDVKVEDDRAGHVTTHGNDGSLKGYEDGKNGELEPVAKDDNVELGKQCHAKMTKVPSGNSVGDNTQDTKEIKVDTNDRDSKGISEASVKAMKVKSLDEGSDENNSVYSSSLEATETTATSDRNMVVVEPGTDVRHESNE